MYFNAPPMLQRAMTNQQSLDHLPAHDPGQAWAEIMANRLAGKSSLVSRLRTALSQESASLGARVTVAQKCADA